MKDQYGQSEERGTKRGSAAAGLRQVPLLLLMVAAVSIVLLSLSTVAIAAASQAGDLDDSRLKAPMLLPGDAGTSSSRAYGAGAERWIIGATSGNRTARLARIAGAEAVDSASGIYSIDRSAATSFAENLSRSGLLVYAEPNVPVSFSGYPADVFGEQQWWLDRIVNTTEITPPPVTPDSPRLGLIEESVNPAHPDLREANLDGAFALNSPEDTHGTAIAAIAGSPGEGAGIRGVWPGMNMTLFPSGKSCATATEAVFAAARARVAAINMSYGFPSDVCFSHYVATEAAVRKGVLPVAAAGNTGRPEQGNTPFRPATDPHVISVSAVNEEGLATNFATRNDQVDITAPGQGIVSPFIAAGPPGTDQPLDLSWALNSGTSYSTPMVAAAAALLTQERPDLDARRIGRLLTASATDLGAPGRDPLYGEGLLNIDAALTSENPPADPREPNDDIEWIDGSRLNGKAGFVWKPGRKGSGSVVATLGRSKDPADVYRVRIAPRGKVLVTAAQYQGDVKLRVLRPKTKSIGTPKRQLIVRSDKARPKTEGVLVRNSKRKPQLVYVAVTVSKRWSGEYSRYKLKVKRR